MYVCVCAVGLRGFAGCFLLACVLFIKGDLLHSFPTPYVPALHDSQFKKSLLMLYLGISLCLKQRVWKWVGLLCSQLECCAQDSHIRKHAPTDIIQGQEQKKRTVRNIFWVWSRYPKAVIVKRMAENGVKLFFFLRFSHSIFPFNLSKYIFC